MINFLWISILVIFLMFIPSAQARPGQQVFSIKTSKVNWQKHESLSLCHELVASPKYRIKQGPQKVLSFTFQGVNYSAPNLSSDPDKLAFLYAADSDSNSESTTITVDGKIADNKFSGLAKIEIKKDVDLLKPGQTAQWDRHKYDCKVSFSFIGKLMPVQ